MFPIDIENFVHVTRSILPLHPFQGIWSKVQFVAICPKFHCWIGNNEIVSIFEGYCSAPKAHVVWLKIFYFVETMLFSYFLLITFLSVKMLRSQGRTLRLGLNLGIV